MKYMLMTTIAIMAVVSLASCSANSDFDNTTTTDNKAQTSVETPINFGTYLAQSKTTRAGESTPTTASEKSTSASEKSTSASEKSTPAPEMTDAELETKGFGVIAFYTGSTKYEDVKASEVPNFMYNTGVKGTEKSDGWIYSPIKYWPNGGQTGDATPVNATYLSFFAYAPYKTVVDKKTGSTGSDKGITALSGNGTPGDPTVTYAFGATGADADLLWGTAGTYGTKTSEGAQKGTGSSNKVKFKVNANLSKMKVNGQVQFNFLHALAKFGGTGATETDGKYSGLMVMADIDNAPGTPNGKLDKNTKITVKSIKIESVKSVGADTKDPSIPASGTLNLVTGEWTASKTNLTKIDYEINSDAATATEGATTTQTMNKDIAEPASVNSWSDLSNVTGVTTTPQRVYTETNPLLIIPDDQPYTFRITIDYIVRTKDEALSKTYTEVEQSFYKDLTLTNVSLNAKYNLLIHLGLTSVKFEASVSDWTNTTMGGATKGTTDDPDPIVINMPANVK